MSEPATKSTSEEKENPWGSGSGAHSCSSITPEPEMAPSCDVLRPSQHFTFHSHPLLKIHPGSSWLRKPRLENTSVFFPWGHSCSLYSLVYTLSQAIIPPLELHFTTTRSFSGAAQHGCPGSLGPHSSAHSAYTPAPSQLQKVWPEAPHLRTGWGPVAPPSPNPRA